MTPNPVSEKLEAARARVVEAIRCEAAREHSWDGDGCCKRCSRYATDMIDHALEAAEREPAPEGRREPEPKPRYQAWASFNQKLGNCFTVVDGGVRPDRNIAYYTEEAHAVRIVLALNSEAARTPEPTPEQRDAIKKAAVLVDIEVRRVASGGDGRVADAMLAFGVALVDAARREERHG